MGSSKPSTACSRRPSERQEAMDGSKPCAPSSTWLPETSTSQPSIRMPRHNRLLPATHSKFKRARPRNLRHGKLSSQDGQPDFAYVMKLRPSRANGFLLEYWCRLTLQMVGQGCPLFSDIRFFLGCSVRNSGRAPAREMVISKANEA